MPTQFSYRDYVSDTTFMEGYKEYQKQFSKKIRECDKVMIELVRGIVEKDLRSGKQPSLLDIGCSAGNLLCHMKRMIPGLRLTGGDMVQSILSQNRSDPALSDIRFEEMDLLYLGHEGEFDIIIANAVLYLFSEDEFNRALANISAALKPQGWFMVFDFFHPFEQELAVFEKSETHPNGLMLHFRPYSTVMAGLKKFHFTNIDFKPFIIPVDLDRPKEPKDMVTYTLRSDNGTRMLFRGTLFQPWCHLITQRGADDR